MSTDLYAPLAPVPDSAFLHRRQARLERESLAWFAQNLEFSYQSWLRARDARDACWERLLADIVTYVRAGGTLSKDRYPALFKSPR